MHHARRMLGNTKTMTQEEELWQDGTSPLLMEWVSRSLPIASGRLVRNNEIQNESQLFIPN